MYAMGDRDDLTEWLRAVKSWQWLALRVRVGIEPIPVSSGTANSELRETAEGSLPRGAETGARKGKGRGEWTELDKIAEALQWLKVRGRESMLLDLGMGGTTSK